MQIAIEKSLGLQPVEQDVIVLYEGEKEKLENDDFWKVLYNMHVHKIFHLIFIYNLHFTFKLYLCIETKNHRIT